MPNQLSYRKGRSGRLVHCVAVIAAVLAACSNDNSSSGNDPAPTAPPRTAPEPARDEKFIIGALLPQSGEGSTFGAPLLAGVRLALSDINTAGGANGRPVELIVADEGQSPSDAAAATAELIRQNADVIIGPASSRRATTSLATAAAAGVTMCSPTATALSVSDVPDSGLFVRTIASDAVEMAALADQIERRGETSALIVAPNDEYGTRLTNRLVEELELRGLGIDATLDYDPADERFDVAAAAAVAASPRVIAMIGTPGSGGQVLAAVRTRLAASAIDSPLIVLNGAMRSIDTVRALGNDPTFVKQLIGVSPNPNPSSEVFVERLRGIVDNVATDYAVYAYDCAVLAAIAAVTAGPDAPKELGPVMIEASRRGSLCTDYDACLALASQDLSIDYVGASGDLDLASDGDRVGGSYLVFAFDGSGRDITIATILVRGGT